MNVKEQAIGAAQAVVDGWMALMPRRRPDRAAIKRCRIVAHRGAHRGQDIPENTFEAFERACAAGVWGIETDIRWTRDRVPVIIHDPDAERVFGKPIKMADVTFSELREAVPQILSLAELVSHFGGKTHLMLELKDEPFPELELQRQILADHLAPLTPGTDYHFVALDPVLFDIFAIQPRSCCLPVGFENMASLSRASLGTGLGGITGHYVLLGSAMQKRHEQAGEKVGTGFVRSRNSLWREINRNVEWVFTNHAVDVQGFLDVLKRET